MSDISLNELYGVSVRDSRREISKPREFDPQALHQLSHEILNLKSSGMKGRQIAKALGISEGTVSKTVNSDLGAEKLRIIRGASDHQLVKVTDRVAKMTDKALDVLEEILDDEAGIASQSLRRQAARDVLIDLGGHAAPKKVDIRKTSAMITPEFLDELKKQGQLAAQEVDAVIDVEAEEVSNG